jgi:hypothetical protein
LKWIDPKERSKNITPYKKGFTLITAVSQNSGGS